MADSLGLRFRKTCFPPRSTGATIKKKFRVVIEIDEDGIFVANVPSLPGCVSQGITRGDVISNIRKAIAGYMESLETHGEPIPPSILEEVVEVNL